MPTPTRQPPENFLVAFSLAGEQRDLVRAVAEAVEQELGSPNVFFDEWFEHYIAGSDADLKLQKLYSEQCALAVVCVSERYGGKPWTKAEHAAIRARDMQAQDERGRLGILPIRVGDGEIEGILFNTIAPDIRTRTPQQAARLIIDRLNLIIPSRIAAAPPIPDWPEHPPTLQWPMADRTDARTAFGNLLTRNAPSRFLPVRGPSEVGKNHITKQMLSNALRMPNLACGRFDFKGITDLDAEVRPFVQDLEIPMPPASLRLNERLGHILDALKQRARPTLLVFDTYEAAGEASEWVEKQLLPTLIRAAWLRVVIVGQKVPKSTDAICLVLQPPPPEEWFLFGQQNKPGEATLEDVRLVHHLCDGRARVLAQLFGARS